MKINTKNNILGTKLLTIICETDLRERKLLRVNLLRGSFQLYIFKCFRTYGELFLLTWFYYMGINMARVFLFDLFFYIFYECQASVTLALIHTVFNLTKSYFTKYFIYHSNFKKDEFSNPISIPIPISKNFIATSLAFSY